MKEQWSISEKNTQLVNMEDGLYQEKQKCIKKHEYETNCCTRCIPYLRLIFLLEVMLFFGWGCYMILQTYHSGEIRNETISITLESDPSMMKSRASTEMPMIFVKPDVIIDKINNFIEDMKFKKDQHLMQNKAIVTNVPSIMQKNIQSSSNVQSNNMVAISAINRLLATLSSGNLVHDKKFTESSVPEKFFSIKSMDENVNTDKNENSVRPTQFLEKLRNISKIKTTNDLEKFETTNDFTEDLNHLTKNQENHALDMSNKLEDLALISVDLTNMSQDPKQEFSDLTKDAAQDHRNENSSLFDETDERVNERLEFGLVICPPYASHEFYDVLIKDLAKDFSTSQSVLAQEISEQIENGSIDNIDEKNEDKHDINDSDMSMSTSPSGNQDHFDMSMGIAQSTEEQYSPESIEKIKEDEKYESMENIKNSYEWLLQTTVQDSVESSTSNVDKLYSVESLTPNVDKFQWENMPPSYIDLGLGDISKSSEIDSSLSWDDMYEDMDVDDVIPGSQCEITIEMDILIVKCPNIKFDEKFWNFTSSLKILLTDVPKINRFRNIFDIYSYTECDEDANKKLEVENISNENSNKEVTTPRDSVFKLIDTIELQESATSEEISNDSLLDLSDAGSIYPFDSKEISQDYAFYDFLRFHGDSYEEEVKQVTTESSSISEFDSSTIDSNKGRNPFLDISGTQQQEQLKISKEQDHSVSDNTENSLKDFEYFYALEKKLTSLFKNEMSKIMTRYLPKSSYEDYRNNICSIYRYMRSISQYLRHEQYVALRELLGYTRNPDHPHSIDDSYYRKKRMTDDLTWQDQVSNTLEEDDKDADLLENLKKIFQKMEILALCIDRLHERYLLHNRLDDDYVSSEFPIETEERRELHTSQIAYEK